MKRASLFSLMILLIFNVSAFSQKELLYKQIDTTKLYVEVYLPERMDTTKVYSAMVFFFGGGWIGGGRGHFRHQAAATALIIGYNEESDDLSVSSVPNALVLFNPVADADEFLVYNTISFIG